MYQAYPWGVPGTCLLGCPKTACDSEIHDRYSAGEDSFNTQQATDRHFFECFTYPGSAHHGNGHNQCLICQGVMKVDCIACHMEERGMLCPPNSRYDRSPGNPWIHTCEYAPDVHLSLWDKIAGVFIVIFRTIFGR